MDLLDLFVKIGVKDEASDKVSSLGSKLKSGLATAGKVAAAGVGLVTSAAGAAAGALSALEGATEEYRVAQGKLNTAFDAAGFSADAAREAYYGFYGILGDTDTATEASQLLAKLVENEEDIVDWTDIAAGVFGTFGDSLPIEGLIEASNETAKVGTVTGVLADALNWAGISEDEFNAKLAACSSESERNKLIMETLSGTYDEASSAFYQNNQALVKSRDAQTMLMDAMSKLATTIQTVKTGLISDFLPSIVSVSEALNGMLSGTEGASEQFATAVDGLVAVAVEKLPQFLDFGVQIIMALVNGIVSSIPSLVAAVPQVVTAIAEALVGLLPQILDVGVQLLDQFATGIETELPNMVARLPQVIEAILNFITENLPSILEKGVEILTSIMNGIINSIPTLVSALPQVITAITSFMASNLPAIISSGVQLLTSLISGILKTIPSLVSSLPQIINAIVNGMGSMMGSIVQIGVDIVQGIWKGIQSMIGWFTSKVTGFFSGIVNGVKNTLGIHSPSTVFAGIGGYMAEGLGVGWDNQYTKIRRYIENGLDFGTATVDVESSAAGKIRTALSAVTYAGEQAITIVVQSVLDGKVIGETAYQYSKNKQRAYGVT